jgi:hypothetical protein
MLADIGLMIAVYIAFKAVAEFAHMAEVPSKGGFHDTGRLLVVLLGVAVIAVAVAGIMDIAQQGTKATTALVNPDSLEGAYARGVGAGKNKTAIGEVTQTRLIWEKAAAERKAAGLPVGSAIEERLATVRAAPKERER